MLPTGCTNSVVSNPLNPSTYSNRYLYSGLIREASRLNTTFVALCSPRTPASCGAIGFTPLGLAVYSIVRIAVTIAPPLVVCRLPFLRRLGLLACQNR